jgi:hypothetical protein
MPIDLKSGDSTGDNRAKHDTGSKPLSQNFPLLTIHRVTSSSIEETQP